MHCSDSFRRCRCILALLALALAVSGLTRGQQPSKDIKFPYPERLTYRIEWRLVTAGNAVVQLSRGAPDDWEINLHLESAGLVSRLFRVLDNYKVVSNDQFCGTNSTFDAQEGKRHIVTRLRFDNSRHKVEYDERDLVKNTSEKKDLDIAPCTYEVVGALAALRAMNLQPGHQVNLPMTNGKKLVSVKIEGVSKENITVDGKSYPSTKYEAFLFDNVLFKRRGRLFLWITDDKDRIPLEFRLHLGFPTGTVTLQLEKRELL